MIAQFFNQQQSLRVGFLFHPKDNKNTRGGAWRRPRRTTLFGRVEKWGGKKCKGKQDYCGILGGNNDEGGYGIMESSCRATRLT